MTSVLKGQKEFLLGDLPGVVDRSLADSMVEAVSMHLRFIAALNAENGGEIEVISGDDKSVTPRPQEAHSTPTRAFTLP